MNERKSKKIRKQVRRMIGGTYGEFKKYVNNLTLIDRIKVSLKVIRKRL